MNPRQVEVENELAVSSEAVLRLIRYIYMHLCNRVVYCGLLLTAHKRIPYL